MSNRQPYIYLLYLELNAPDHLTEISKKIIIKSNMFHFDFTKGRCKPILLVKDRLKVG